MDDIDVARYLPDLTGEPRIPGGFGKVTPAGRFTGVHTRVIIPPSRHPI